MNHVVTVKELILILVLPELLWSLLGLTFSFGCIYYAITGPPRWLIRITSWRDKRTDKTITSLNLK